jgi:hypothetical protein
MAFEGSGAISPSSSSSWRVQGCWRSLWLCFNKGSFASVAEANSKVKPLFAAKWASQDCVLQLFESALEVGDDKWLMNFETGSDFSTRDPFACTAALRGCNIWGEGRCSLKIGERFWFSTCALVQYLHGRPCFGSSAFDFVRGPGFISMKTFLEVDLKNKCCSNAVSVLFSSDLTFIRWELTISDERVAWFWQTGIYSWAISCFTNFL